MKVIMHFWPFNVNDATLIVIKTFGSNANLQELFIQIFFGLELNENRAKVLAKEYVKV